MRWYVPLNKLSSKQIHVLSSITESLEKPHWIKGFAGTGKTLIVIHLIGRIAELYPKANLCFITYTNSLVELVNDGLPPDLRRRVTVMTHTKFMSQKRRYNYVFLDEVQDIKAEDLGRIVALSERLYVAGDPDQRIYPESANDDEVMKVTEPKEWELLEVFRLTPRLRQVACSVLPAAKIVEGSDAVNTADVTIRLVPCTNPEQEVSWVWDQAIRRARPGYPSVILLPNHNAIGEFAQELSEYLDLETPPKVAKYGRRDYTDFNAHWNRHETPLEYLGNGSGELSISDRKPMVYLMTYHSSKGLDFANVFIPFLNARTNFASRKWLEADPILDRRLLFVAVTRSRENLFMSYTGRHPHPFVKELPKDAITIADPHKTGDSSDDEEDFF